MIDLTGGAGSNDGGRGVVPEVTTTTASRPTARAYAVWLVALAAYTVAVFHRASLGVAGVEAQERFSAGASAVSLFLVLQLAVYAGLQVPVGVALDRFGSRRLVLAGGLTMAAGQLVLALATDVPTAVAARVLVGAAVGGLNELMLARVERGEAGHLDEDTDVATEVLVQLVARRP